MKKDDYSHLFDPKKEAFSLEEISFDLNLEMKPIPTKKSAMIPKKKPKKDIF